MERKTDCRKWIWCWYFLYEHLYMIESQDTFSFLDIYILKHFPKLDHDKLNWLTTAIILVTD